MLRTRIYSACAVLVGTALSVGCGDASQFDEQVAGEQTEELSGTDAICDAVSALGSVAIGDDQTGAKFTSDCDKKSGKQLSYLGGEAPSKFSKSVSPLEAKTLFCALKGADDQEASASLSTIVGGFGAKTKVNIYDSDPSTMTLKGQRISTIYAFGVGLKVESQAFGWTFPTEDQASQNVTIKVPIPPFGTYSITDSLPAQTGQYARGTSTAYDWYGDLKVSFPIGPLAAAVGVRLENVPLFQTGARRGYYMSGVNGSLDDTRMSSWDTFYSACTECQAHPTTAGGIILPCNCPTTDELYQHYRPCGSDGCTEDYFADLDDGRVPHENRRGAAGPYWDQDSSEMSDFWQYGRPGSGSRSSSTNIAEGEPFYSIKDKEGDLGKMHPEATTGLDVNFGFNYDAGVADIGFTVNMDSDWRSGVALREYRQPFADVSGRYRVTELGLDAQAAVGVDARVVINLDLPFVGSTNVFDETFTVVSRTTKQSSSKVPSQVIWDDTSSAKVLSYTAKGASASFDSCLTAAPVDGDPVEATSPSEWIDDVREVLPTKLHPCHVTICSKASSTAKPKKTTCKWVDSTKSLSCTTSTDSCTCLDNEAMLCDEDENIVGEQKSLSQSGCFDVPR